MVLEVSSWLEIISYMITSQSIKLKLFGSILEKCINIIDTYLYYLILIPYA